MRPPQPEGDALSDRKLLLLVEDDPVDARELELALERAGQRDDYRIVRAGSLAEAFERLEEEPPDLVALDLSLPDASGEEGVDRLRERAPELGVVVLTGRDDDELALRLLEKGAQDYLLKATLEPRELARCLRYSAKRAEAERALAHAQRSAEEATRAKSSFVATMSHEVRTPLGAILGMAELLRATKLCPDQREYVGVLERAGRGLLDLLNNVLELSRLESGRLELAREPVELRSLVVDTAEIFAHAAHRKGVDLVADVAEELPALLLGDGARLRQVLVNLVGNATKFTERGAVEILALRRDGALELAVRDSGPGLPEGRIEALFGRFEQGDDRVAERHGGSGLGLALCREIVEHMGGELHAANRPEGGALFTVLLPLEAVPDAEADEPSPDADLAGWRVLVVDDEGAERSVCAGWLRRAGAEVRELATVGEADRALRAGPGPDALVVDARMRDRGGIEWLEALRAEGRALPACLVVLLMLNHRSADRRRCRALGAVPLLKTARRAALLRAVAGEGHAPPDTAACAAAPALPRPLHVLLAEDSADNRVLARAYLEGTGAELHCVTNGRDAVEARRRGRFDVVLMDVGMPDMDGLEATRRIRAHEREAGLERVPVVAVTAHVVEEVSRELGPAGCDDALIKPFDRAALLAALRRAAPSGDEAPAPVEASARTVSMPALDPEVADLVPEYLERRAADAAALRRAIDAGEFERVRTLGHRMKGSGSSYGLPEVTSLGRALEAAGRARDPKAARRARGELERLVASLRSSTRAEGDSAGAESAGRPEAPPA